MKTDELKIQIRAFAKYLTEFIEVLKKINGKREKDENGNEKPSERDEYFDQHREPHRISQRYSRLRKSLIETYPEVFPDSLVVETFPTFRGLEELSRELTYVLDVLDATEINNQAPSNENYYPFGDAKSADNSPFSEVEKEQIKIKLKEIEKQVIEVVEKQEDLSEKVKQIVISSVKDQTEDLIKSSEVSNRENWKLRLESFAINVASTLIFSAEARLTFTLAIQLLFNYLYHVPLLLPVNFPQLPK